MAVKLIQVHDGQITRSPNMARLFITNFGQGKAPVECGSFGGTHLPFMSLCARTYADVDALICRWLKDLHSMMQDVTLAIHSDCITISALDVAFIASVALPDVRIETPDGCQITGFGRHISPFNFTAGPSHKAQAQKQLEACNG